VVSSVKEDYVFCEERRLFYVLLLFGPLEAPIIPGKMTSFSFLPGSSLFYLRAVWSDSFRGLFPPSFSLTSKETPGGGAGEDAVREYSLFFSWGSPPSEEDRSPLLAIKIL